MGKKKGTQVFVSAQLPALLDLVPLPILYHLS